MEACLLIYAANVFGSWHCPSETLHHPSCEEWRQNALLRFPNAPHPPQSHNSHALLAKQHVFILVADTQICPTCLITVNLSGVVHVGGSSLKWIYLEGILAAHGVNLQLVPEGSLEISDASLLKEQSQQTFFFWKTHRSSLFSPSCIILSYNSLRCAELAGGVALGGTYSPALLPTLPDAIGTEMF